MTVATTVNRESFNGDGVTVTFDFTFKAFVDTDIKVVVRDAVGTETTLILDTDYTAIVNAGVGGTVTLIGAYAATPPATGEKVTIYRDIPYTQQIDPIENDPQRADVQEEGLDRAVILTQQLKDMLARSIQLPVSTAFANLSLPEPQAEKYLRWNAAGTAMENIALTGSLIAVSAYMQTLLDDADAAAALATLGLDTDLLTLALPANTTISAYIKTLLDDADAAAARATLGIPLPPNHLSGLGMTHATDTEHDITVAAGKARDATDAADIVLASAITKQSDATWAVGTNAGGMAASESLPTSGTIHVWLIKRSDTGVVDVMFNNHATSGLTPTLPTGYDYKRRIGSYRTNSSANIINGTWWGTGLYRLFLFHTPVLDVNATNPGASAVLAALSVPGGVNVAALVNAQAYRGTSVSIGVYLSNPANADLAPSTSASPLCSAAYNNNGAIGPLRVITNTSSQIRYRIDASGAADIVRIATLGWEDSL